MTHKSAIIRLEQESCFNAKEASELLLVCAEMSCFMFILHQDLSSRPFKSCKLWGGASMDRTCLTHRRSTGLRSGDPDWSAAMQPHMQQTAMHCVFWHLSIRTSINFFSNLSNSSLSVGSDHMDWSLLPTCIYETWAMTLSPVQHCSILGPLLIDTDHCRPGTPHKSCSSGDALAQSSSNHNLALVKLAEILMLAPFFLPLTHQLWGQHVDLLPNISHPLTGDMMKR